MLTPDDDRTHRRPEDASDTWQENCFLLARDEASDLCAYLHVERMAHGVEVKAAVDVAGTTTWHDGHGDWWYEVDTPFDAVRWRWAGGPLAIDLRLRSVLGAIDHAAALDELGLPGAERDHYEVAGTCEGTVTVDGTSRPFSGLYVRDHTWGAREYHRFGDSWWWPTCFDGGAAYASGVAIDLDGRTVGYGIVADADGVASCAEVAVEVTGPAEPGGYTATTITYAPAGRAPVVLTSETRHHLCTTFPGFGADRRWNDAYSLCRWGDRTGFGTRELGC